MGFASVTTSAIARISDTTALGIGVVNDFGGSGNVNAGLVWDTSSHANPGNVAPGSSGYPSFNGFLALVTTGPFSLIIGALIPGTTYYVRTVAYNNLGGYVAGGYSYSDEVTFTATISSTNVQTNTATNVLATTATLNGTIANLLFDATLAIPIFATAEGFVWDTISHPDPGNGTAPSSSAWANNVTTPATIVSTASESAGSVVTITCTGNVIPVGTTVMVGGFSTLTWLNGQTVTLIAPTNSTTMTFVDATSHGTQGSVGEGLAAIGFPLGTFTANISGLTPNTPLYYAAVSQQGTFGWTYGPVLTTVTLGFPVVTTDSITDITTTSATFNGSVVSVGAPGPCTQVGFVFGAASHPDPGNVSPGASGYTTTASSSGTFYPGPFSEPSSSFTTLTIGTTYFIRAFAQSPAGYAYGNELTFSTLGAFQVTPPSVSVVAGLSAGYTVTTAGSFFSGTVTLSVTSTLPAGASASFAPATVAASGGVSALTISTTGGTTPAGSYFVTVKGTDGTNTKTVTVLLVVQDYSLSISPGSQTVLAGFPTNYTVTLSSLNGFVDIVNLTVSGMPTGVSATLSPASLVGAGTSNLQLITNPTTAAGSYTLTVTGTDGTLTRTATCTLVINAEGWALRWNSI